MRIKLIYLLPAAVLTLSSRPSFALDRFEIQVYKAEANRPGQVGLEVHTNYTIRGQTEPAYDGHVPPQGVGRVTFEPALGITRWFELGAYFQTMVSPDEGFQYGGVKLRGKFVVPREHEDRLHLGVNVEIGRVPRHVEIDGWANEFRPIVGYDDGHIGAFFNPIFGYTLSGPDRFCLHFEPAGKLAFNTQLGFSLGAEYYAGLGMLKDGFLARQQQEHLIFAVFDLAHPADAKEEEEDGEWELNVAAGRSLTDATGQHFILKAIVGRSL